MILIITVYLITSLTTNAQSDSVVVNRVDTINLVPIVDLPYFKYTKVQMGYLKRQLEAYDRLSLLYKEQEKSIGDLNRKISLLGGQINDMEGIVEEKSSIIVRKDKIIKEQEVILGNTKKYYKKRMRYSVGVGVIIGTLLTLIAVR